MAEQIIIIGGGFAGLSAAVRLAAEGVRVLVLEARGRLGGRATAYIDKSTGEEVDNGQHVLAGCYRETFDFLRTVGALAHVHVQTTLAVPFIDEAGRASRLQCPRIPSPFHLVAGVLRWNGVGWRDRAALTRVGGVLRKLPVVLARDGVEALGRFVEANETVDGWLVRHGQPERLRRMFWEPLAVAALNQDVRVASATPFLRVLAEMFGPDPQAAALGLPLVPLDRMYAEPARRFIETHGGCVRTHALARVIVEGGALRGVEVRGEGGRDEGGDGGGSAGGRGSNEGGDSAGSRGAGRIEASGVIAAVPWFALATTVREEGSEVLAPLFATAAAMRASPIVTVNVWFDRPVIHDLFVGLPGRVMQWVFDKRAIWTLREPAATGAGTAAAGAGAAGGARGGAGAAGAVPAASAAHLSLVSSGAEAVLRKTNDELVQLAIEELRAALPAAREATLIRATVVREPQATFSLAPDQPRRPDVTTAVPGFFVAGDWTNTGLPATIESAVLSGRLAARAALRAGGRRDSARL